MITTVKGIGPDSPGNDEVVILVVSLIFAGFIRQRVGHRQNQRAGQKEANFFWQRFVAENTFPLASAVSMGQAPVSYALHQKILTNRMQNIFFLIFVSFRHLKRYHQCAEAPTHILSSQCPGARALNFPGTSLWLKGRLKKVAAPKRVSHLAA
jgi:hypothetical protein